MSVDRADPGRGDPAGMLAASRERASKAATVRAAQVEMRRAAAEADPSVWSGASRESFIVAAAAAATELETLASRWEAESAARAPELAAFEKGIFATMPGVPTVSYENSYASAIGSAAEAYGGTPTVRVLSASVGATFGYEPAPDVIRYAIQAPNDINRYYAGLQAWEVGFGVAPESIPGINVLDSGQSGLPINAAIAQVELGVGGPLAVAVQIPDSVSNHIDTMSDDIQKNAASMREVQRLLAGTAGATR